MIIAPDVDDHRGNTRWSDPRNPIYLFVALFVAHLAHLTLRGCWRCWAAAGTLGSAGVCQRSATSATLDCRRR